MDLRQALLTMLNNFAGTVTAIIALAGIVAKIKPIGLSLKRFFFAELYADDERQDKRLDRLELWQLKQIICDRRLPLEERIDASDSYLSRGANGKIRAVSEELVAEYRRQNAEDRDRREREGRERRRLPETGGRERDERDRERREP